ncbi:MAG TPA: hypothetical protein VM451_05830 [Candidatus Limnocylindria bacterium]|nr:hypothetical protein [Candidatus Limnocylindria bacterium]
MAPLSNQDVMDRYLDAHRRHDYAELGRFRAPGWYQEWPQSRERVRGHADDEAIMRSWPGGEPTAGESRVVGSEDRWVVTPALTFQRVVGAGEMWFMDGTGHYPDGSTWFIAGLFQVRDGQVHRETWYFGPELPAPEWRASFVEPMDPLERSDQR